MPIYEWQAEDGDIIERTFRMLEDKPDKILRDAKGHECYVDDVGKAYKTQKDYNPQHVTVYIRVFGNCQVDAGEHRSYPYMSLRLKGQVHKDHVPHGDGTIRGVAHTNVPIIQSAAHEREVMARYNFDRE